MSQAKVVPLDVGQDMDASALGSKAMNLVRMKRLGLPVPPGFCVLASAFEEHLEENHLVSHISSTLSELKSASPEDRTTLLSGLRQTIIKAPMAVKLKQDIENHYGALGADRVAVRSSATSEDLPGHSFAGQYDTYLGVANLPGCLHAITKCWASLWTERAYEYRSKSGLDHLSVKMAVIVQTLIPADASGVVFTRDPVSGRPDRLIIEACLGLGQALVSGRVAPDRFVLAKTDLRVLSRTVSPKKVMSVLDEAGTVREQAVAPERASSPSIDESTARRLAELAMAAEAAFGTPQDLEWVVSGTNVFLLQSRPITALPSARSHADRQVWTNANVGEVLPDVVTPMNWSLLTVFISALFGSVFDWIGIDLGDNPLIGKVGGRAYFNINTFAAAIRHFPGLRKMDLTQVLGGEQGRLQDLGQLEICEEDMPDLRFSRLKMTLTMPSFLFRILTHSPKRGAKYVAETREKGEWFLRLNLSSLSEEALVAMLRDAANEIYRRIHGIAFSGLGMFYFTQLDKVCRKWLEDKEGTYANRLLAGMGDMDIAQAGLQLWHLAAQAHEHPAVAQTILAGERWEITRKRIRAAEGGSDFLSGWDRFMARHGHHTRGELEVFNPRWSETPDYILDTIRGYLTVITEENPLENYKRRAHKRSELARDCRKRLKNPIRRMLFSFYLNQAQRGCVLRENIKSVAVLYWAAMRLMLLELGRRLAKRRVLESREDIFFLSLDELGPVRQGETDFDVKETIGARRADYERNLSITPPKVVIGRFDPESSVPDEMRDNLEILKGIAVSPGVVTGKARVILRSAARQQILPGEVLVAPFTDPGWTPYFLLAAAIVVDQGGLLSHGSIIAREYGIPAVVNVGPATKLIKTGQNIQVDGNNGVVTILP